MMSEKQDVKDCKIYLDAGDYLEAMKSLMWAYSKKQNRKKTQPTITVEELEDYLAKEVFVAGKTKNISEIAQEILNLIERNNDA